jgi:hypothetical protein
MKKQLLISGIIAILITVGFSGCSTQNNNNNQQNPQKMMFIGMWTSTKEKNNTMELYSNGTFITMLFTGLWDLTDGKFVMEIPDYGYTYEYDYTFSNDNRTLTLVYPDGRTQVYTKQ